MGYPISSKITQELAQDSWAPTGDIVDPSWYRFLRFESGKTHPQAAVILARIFYMYRPVRENVLDQESGLVCEVRYFQKFKSDLWQTSRQSLADTFGFTVREVDSALNTLRESKIIYTELRSLIVHGVRLSNVLYVGLNLPKLKEISTPMTFERNTSCFESTEVLRQKALPISIDCKTDTKTFRKTSLNTSTKVSKNEKSSPSAVPSTSKTKINIPESILSLVPENKRNDNELAKVSAALSVVSEEIVRFNIARALSKAKEDDPWGMVVSMLTALVKNNDWYAADRQRIAEKEEKHAASRRQGAMAQKAKTTIEEREAKENQELQNIFIQMPVKVQQIVEGEARRRVELYNPGAESITLVVTDVMRDIQNGNWLPPELSVLD